MNSQQLAKVRARGEHLLDLYIGLRERYAMLRPLAFDELLSERVGGGPPAHGRVILQNALLQHCVMDVVKLTVDASDRAPSVLNIMSVLADDGVRSTLREDYSLVPPAVNMGDDPISPELLEEIIKGERREFEERFNETWRRLSERWAVMQGGARIERFKTWRDELIAHVDLHHSDGEYHLTDLSTLGLTWADINDVVVDLQQVVSDIQALTRSAGFAWEMLDEQLNAASRGFWMKLGRADSGSGSSPEGRTAR